MFPASSRGGGVCLAFPDVCKIPAKPVPIPTPFPNIAQCAMANPATCAKKVTFAGQAAIHIGTTIPMTSGDEAGSEGGVVSGTVMQQAAYRVGLPHIKIEGSDAITQLMPTAHNGSSANAPAGVQVAPSQATVLLL